MGQFDAPDNIDPAVVQAILNYIWSTQQGTPSPLDLTDLPIPQIPVAGEPYGDQDYINSRLTLENKATNLAFNPEFVGRLGPTAGGPSADSFNPTVTYERVGTPAAVSLERAAQSGDPVSMIVADELLNGGTKTSAEQAVINAWSDSTHPFHDALRANPALMTQGRFGADPEINLDRINATADEIYSYVENDPYFSPLTPGGAAGNVDPGFTDGTVLQDGGEIVQGADGNYYRRTEEESEMAKVFRESGIENPYGTYDPNILADRDTLDREAKIFRDYEASFGPLAEAEARYAQVMNPQGPNPLGSASLQGFRDLTDFVRQAADEADALARQPTSFGPSPTPTNPDAFQFVEPSFNAGFSSGSNPTRANWQRMASTPDRPEGATEEQRQAMLKKIFDERRLEDQKKAQGQRRVARKDNWRAQYDAEEAWAEQLKREKGVRDMAQQGMSPYYDQQRAINANIYGGNANQAAIMRYLGFG